MPHLETPEISSKRNSSQSQTHHQQSPQTETHHHQPPFQTEKENQPIEKYEIKSLQPNLKHQNPN